MESIFNPVIQEIVSSKSLTLKSQEIKPLCFGESSFFVTGVYRITLTVIQADGDEKVLYLLAKTANGGAPGTEFVRMHLLFNNEFMFYEKYVKLALPMLKEYIPEYYYGKIEDRGNECLVIEFLKDYNMCKGLIFIPNDHVELACKELGKFHGIGYIAKENDPEGFGELCASLLETRCGRDALVNQDVYDKFHVFLRALAVRAFEYLPGKDDYPKIVLDKYKAKVQDSSAFQVELYRAKNDLATVCHGDYNRNNIMFRYGPDNSIESLKMIDFQTTRYGQPGLDLSTLLSGNVKYDMLQENFEKYFHLYHTSLINTIETNSSIDSSKFAYERCLQDYVEHSWLGFYTILFFLPVLENPQIITNVQFDETEFTPEMLEAFFKVFGSPELLKHTGMYLKHCIDWNEKYAKYE